MSVQPHSPSSATPSAARARRNLIPAYAVLLCAVCGIVALTSDPSRIIERPLLFAVLVAATLVMHALRFDLFGRGTQSPAAITTIAVAALFGPLGVLAVEGALALHSAVVRRVDFLGWSFDFGALSLCGMSAALTFSVLPSSSEPWVLAVGTAAGIAYYVTNSTVLVGVWLLDEGVNPQAAWRERMAWLAPHYPVYGLLGGVLIVAVQRLDPYVLGAVVLPLVIAWLGQKQYLDRSRRGVEELRESNTRLGEANDALTELVSAKNQLLAEKSVLLERVRLSYLQTVASLARTIEAKDPYTGGHTERVSDYAVMLATELGFTAEELRAVETGGVIHDIGKIGVRDQVLLKSGRLDEEEWVEMRRHPEISSYILGELGLPEIAKDMARSHHERFDGRGYPDGLRGEAIPLAARVLSVADTLDAMTSDRPYRNALTFDETLDELRRNSGSQFCPRVVGALLTNYAREPKRWRRDTSDTFVAAFEHREEGPPSKPAQTGACRRRLKTDPPPPVEG